MTAEKKNGIYMKVISFLLGSLVLTILYVWDGATARLTEVEKASQKAEIERALLLDGDEDIIKVLGEFKKDVKEQFKELKEEIRK